MLFAKPGVSSSRGDFPTMFAAAPTRHAQAGGRCMDYLGAPEVPQARHAMRPTLLIARPQWPGASSPARENLGMVMRVYATRHAKTYCPLDKPIPGSAVLPSMRRMQ